MNVTEYSIGSCATILEAIKKIEKNKRRFVIVLHENKLVGTLTDGDIRRALIQGYSLNDNIKNVINLSFEFLYCTDTFDTIVSKFKSNKITFLPIVNNQNELVNVITKEQLHSILIEGWELDLETDFNKFDKNTIFHEIYNRPWGYYKTVFLSKYAQAKTIHVNPLQQLSLQFHKKREEHWVVIKGEGYMTIGESHRSVSAGTYIFIPKGCLHRIRNTSSKELLVISEVQLGEYFGEDDIIRIEDDYGRK